MKRVFIKNKVIIILFLFLFSLTFMQISREEHSKNFSYGTTVIVLRKPDKIIIGTDSKGSILGTSKSENCCKIFRFENTVFAIAGFKGDLETFNLPSIVLKACKIGSSVKNKADVFQDIVLDELSNLIEYSKYVSQKEYEKLKDYLICSVVFAAVEDDELKICIRKVGIDTIKGELSVLESIDCPGNCGEEIFTYVAGSKKRITNNELLFLKSVSDPVDVIHGLIELETIANPEQVGLPVDIIELDKKGLGWVKNKPECEKLEIVEMDSKIPSKYTTWFRHYSRYATLIVLVLVIGLFVFNKRKIKRIENKLES